MINTEPLDELYAIRCKLAKQCDYDVNKYGEMLREYGKTLSRIHHGSVLTKPRRRMTKDGRIITSEPRRHKKTPASAQARKNGRHG